MTADPSDVLLADHVSVITGAARGIGAATAVGLAKFGSDVVVCDRDAESLAATADAVAASGRRVLSFNIDVRDYDAVDEMFDAVKTSFGRLDVLVNNAGGTFFSPFEAVSPKGEQALIAENFTSVTHCIRRSVELMAEHGGSIVNITSIEAHRAAPGFAIYAAMKTAVMGLTKTLALELATRRIRVNCIAPDMIFTEASRSFIGSMEATGHQVAGSCTNKVVRTRTSDR